MADNKNCLVGKNNPIKLSDAQIKLNNIIREMIEFETFMPVGNHVSKMINDMMTIRNTLNKISKLGQAIKLLRRDFFDLECFKEWYHTICDHDCSKCSKMEVYHCYRNCDISAFLDNLNILRW